MEALKGKNMGGRALNIGKQPIMLTSLSSCRVEQAVQELRRLQEHKTIKRVSISFSDSFR